MCVTEGIIDIDIRNMAQFGSEGFVVLLLFPVETEVLEEEDASGVQIIHHFPDLLADAVRGQ